MQVHMQICMIALSLLAGLPDACFKERGTAGCRECRGAGKRGTEAGHVRHSTYLGKDEDDDDDDFDGC